MEDNNITAKNSFLTGVLFCAQGKNAEAEKEFEQVAPDDSNFKQAQVNLKWISYCKETQHDKFIANHQNRRPSIKNNLSIKLTNSKRMK